MTKKQLQQLIQIADYLADLATNLNTEYGRVDLDDIRADIYNAAEEIKKIIIPNYEKLLIEEYEAKAMELIENSINQLIEEKAEEQ